MRAQSAYPYSFHNIYDMPYFPCPYFFLATLVAFLYYLRATGVLVQLIVLDYLSFRPPHIQHPREIIRMRSPELQIVGLVAIGLHAERFCCRRRGSVVWD